MATRSRPAKILVVDKSDDPPSSSSKHDGGGTRSLSPTTEWHELSSTISKREESYNGGGGHVTVHVAENGPDTGEDSETGTRRVLFGIKSFIGVLLFAIVLVSTVLSKVTLISMTGKLRNHMWNIHANAPKSNSEGSRGEVAVLYWQLLFVMVLPHCVTFLRSFFVGVFGKTRKSFPWPTPRAAVLGVLLAIVEVFSMSIFVFLALGNLPPHVSLFLLNGVFIAQIGIDVFRTPFRPTNHSRHSYDPLEQQGARHTSKLEKLRSKLNSFFGAVFENKVTKAIALILQVAAIVGLAVYLGVNGEDDHIVKSFYLRSILAFSIVLFVMSIIWSDKVQLFITKTTHTVGKCDTARYRASFIYSGVKIFLYPFISYIVFRFATLDSHDVDPWCLDGSHCTLDFSWTGTSLAIFLVQILATFVAYWFAWVACTMTLEWCSMALPLLVATPLSVLWYYIAVWATDESENFFPFDTRHNSHLDHFYNEASAIACVLWISQVLAMGYYLWTHANIILAQDTDMFLVPHYDGVFLEQQLILNRQKNRSQKDTALKYERSQRTVFICSTMYHENDIEMRQMLTSIYRVACHLDHQHPSGEGDKFESHIFFDGSLNGTQLTYYALQLVSLLEDTLKVDLKRCNKQQTPYGFRMSWMLCDNMPFTVHLKDNLKVKNKKRWSQVMYMNYVINHRIKSQGLDPRNTFILTTDADIDFTADSAIVLLDTLASNPKVAAVCARTHPKGAGPLYWYQVFDYAVGHWFLKPAEHIMGCVLCCPGCFSVFRCKALMDALDTYASNVTGAFEFLTKDMGEDRWLCTLLIEHGWRLEYCAISEDYTYCPEAFDEYFKQRRRWIPSTVANLTLLISEAKKITSGNDTVSILFVLFQFVIVFSTAISPATVILIIASGMGSAYQLSNSAQTAIIVILILVSVAYGVICLYTSQQTQLDVAKLLTFIFAIIMAVTFAGILKDTVNDLIATDDPSWVALVPAGSSNNKSYDSGLGNTTDDTPVQLPVSINTIYTFAFALTFLVAALLHLPEWSCLLHSIWYLIALPSGYLLLLIYSAANLDSQSWGTREGKAGGDQGGYALLMSSLHKAWAKTGQCFRRICGDRLLEGGTRAKKEEKEHLLEEVKSHDLATAEPPAPREPRVVVNHKKMSETTKEWLRSLECERYIPNFEEHGYVNEHFIASMKTADFDAIGIDKRGFKLRLEKASKSLPSLPIETDVPRSVKVWLGRLELEEYTELFHSEGYRTEDDIENLKDLTEKHFLGMGIHKRAHLQRLKAAIKSLFYPSAIELQIRNTKGIIENVQTLRLANTDPREADFWENLVHTTLKPVRVRLTQIDDLKDNLRTLRNSTLAIILLVNLMWIILLYTLTFSSLTQYNLPDRAFSLLFLAVYGFVIVIQFVALICHRVVTLVHYLGRVKSEELVVNEREDALMVTFRADTTFAVNGRRAP